MYNQCMIQCIKAQICYHQTLKIRYFEDVELSVDAQTKTHITACCQFQNHFVTTISDLFHCRSVLG